MNKRAAMFQDSVDVVNTAMNNLLLPIELQDSVRQYMFTNQSSNESQRELNDFLSLISPSLRIMVLNHEFS